MHRCADCDHLILRGRDGESFAPGIDFRINGASIEANQGTIDCELGASALAEEAAMAGGSATSPTAVAEVLWRLRQCARYRIIGSND